MDIKLTKPIFCLTVPKSGTHLLANVLRALLGNENVFPGLIHKDHLLDSKFVIEPKVYVGHVAYSLEISDRIRESTKILLCRDPRDIAVSLCNSLYSSKKPPDPLTNFVTKSGVPFHEALGAMITGSKVAHADYPSIQQLFSIYHFKWLPVASLVVRYEDLLGEEDSWGRASETYRNILNLVGVNPDDSQIRDIVEKGSDPAISATFHEGKAGKWRNAFLDVHVKQFKAIAPNLVSLLGYEENENWPYNNNESLKQIRRPVPTNHTSQAADAGVQKAAAEGAAPSVISGFSGAILDDIRAHIDVELNPIRNTIKKIKALEDNVHQRISFLNIKEYNLGFFCWTDDFLHRSLGQTFVDNNVYLRYLHEHSIHPDPEFAQKVLRQDFERPLFEVIEPYIKKKKSVHFFDVGCGYGLESVILASAFSRYGKLFQATGFDPGWAGKLASFNFALNGFGKKIGFEPLAVTSHNEISILYGEYGQLENCRTVNRMIATENFSYPCGSTTIDAYVRRKKIRGSIAMKIDIQGGEYHALLGAQRTLKMQCRALLLKFIPHALSTSIDPQKMLSVIPGKYRIYDANGREKFTRNEIKRKDFPKYAGTLWNSNPDYSYLLFRFD